MALMLELYKSPKTFLEFKRLERDSGFLYHMTITFDQIFPYLKDFHLNLCGNLRRRNANEYDMLTNGPKKGSGGEKRILGGIVIQPKG